MPLIAKGQEYSYVHYSPTEGLVQNQIMCCFQDSKGFIWLGTKGGLSRFDGLEFKNYTVNEGLAANFINHITEDSSGNILAFTRKGFSYFIDNKIYNFFCNIDGFDYNTILSYKETKKHNWVIVCFSDSVFHYINFKDGTFKSDSIINNSLKDFKFSKTPMVDFVKFNNYKNTLFFTNNGSELYTLHDGIITKELESFAKIKKIFWGDDNQLYLYINDKIYRYYNNQLLFYTKILNEIPKDLYESFFIDKRGKFYYIDNENHLHIGSYIDQYKNSVYNRGFVDKEGILWLWGEAGLHKIQSQAFVNYIPDKCAINNNVWCISEDKNKNIYFGSFEGSLVKYYNGKFERVNLAQKIKLLHRQINFYIGNAIDKYKNIFFAIPDIYSFDGNSFKKLDCIEKEYSSLFTYYNSSDEKILAGTNLGLLIKEKNKTGLFYNVYPGNEKGRNIVSIVKDKFNRYWFGGFSKISILDKNKVIHFPDKKFPFKYGGNTMYVDYRGNIWIGNEKGLFLYDYKSFKKINNSYFNSISGFITAIDNKHLLIGNMNQLGVFYLENYYISGKPFIKLYNKSNGFWGAECGQNGAFKDSKGYLWIPAADRVVRFDPTLKVINRIQPNVFIKGISIIDKNMHKNIIRNEITQKGKITLNHTQKDIRFDYLAVNTTAPERVKYKYYLEGYDKVWTEATSLRFVVYTNLQSGDYNFYLSACNEDNIWTDIPQMVSIKILEAYWKTIWFNIMIITVIIGISVLLTYLYFLRRKKKQIDKLENDKMITELQLNTIKGQIDPHFTFNVINSIASVIYKEDKQCALNIFTKFSNLLRIVINSSSQTFRTIDEEIIFVNNYLEIEKFRFKDKFDFVISIDNNVDKFKNIPKMIIQTHVENAIKHGLMHKEKNGILAITIAATNDETEIIIEDNGIGREKAKILSHHSTGMGLKIINSYYDLFNKYNDKKITQQIIDLNDVNNEPLGTKIIIRIPINFNFKI